MLEAKLDGQEITKPEPVVETPVVDLMEALKQSVAAARKPAKGDGAKRAASKGGSRKQRDTAARKSA